MNNLCPSKDLNLRSRQRMAIVPRSKGRRARAKIVVLNSGLLGAHGHFNAAQDFQSLSLPRFSPDVVWGVHVEHWYLDADCGAGLADLPAEPFGVSPGVGSVSGRDSDISVFADRWRGGGSH